jgi:PAS domain S-box-containing protein
MNKMVDDWLEKTIDDKKITAYKVTISILFGLLGFVVNFQSINLYFPPYTATILIGLLFPILITLAWGWRYGLLSALAGGCQSMWWIWGPSNGYAIFFVVPPFTLWILWHGFFAKVRRQRQGNEWWLNAYVVEIPFRILSTINLYTLSRWAITHNPPPWDWACSASSTIPVEFSTFVVIKQCVVGYIILLLADVLLNLGFLRRFFRMEEQLNQTKTGYIISTSLLLGVLFWVVDSLIGSLVFYTDRSFLDLLALNIPPYVLYVRYAFILACLIGGMVASNFLRRQLESEVALRESEDRFRTIFDSINDAVFIHNIETGAILYVNNTACDMYGYTREELSRLDVQTISMGEAPYTQQVAIKWIKKTALGEPQVFEWMGKHKSGRLFRVEVSMRSAVVGGCERLLVVVRDITQRKAAEEELQKRTIALERSNKDLEQFAYVASHDLQEPLRMVSSYVQLLARRYEGKLDHDADDFIGYAVDGANRMQTLIDDLLIFSRVGTQSKPFEPTNCETVLEHVLTNLKMAIEDSYAMITHDPLPTIMADGSQFTQLLQNLVSNAIKFQGEEPPHIHISAEQKGDEWEFSVADNGIGIKPEFFERIFVIFQRLHGRDEYSGTGIGLAVCKKIVERHGGRIWVESEPGEGTTFFFTIQ